MELFLFKIVIWMTLLNGVNLTMTLDPIPTIKECRTVLNGIMSNYTQDKVRTIHIAKCEAIRVQIFEAPPGSLGTNP